MKRKRRYWIPEERDAGLDSGSDTQGSEGNLIVRMATGEEEEAGSLEEETQVSTDISQAVLTQNSGQDPETQGPPAISAFSSVKMVMGEPNTTQGGRLYRRSQTEAADWSWAADTCS